MLTKPSWLNQLSWSKQKRKIGSKAVIEDLKQQDNNFATLKTTLVTVAKSDDYRYQYFKDLNEHLAYLETEFSGQPQLLFYHAKLIVLIRRDCEVEQNMQRFTTLWQEEADFLLEHLSMRWIVSAIDTFIDYSEDDLLKSMLFSGLLLINTTKLYETERYYLHTENITPDNYDPQRLESPTSPMLFNGIPAFRINHSDTMSNMRGRMSKIIVLHPLGGKILNHIYLSLHKENTVFHRFKQLHTKARTQWWH